MLDEQTVYGLKSLCECSKTSYSDGEKKKFSGYMNTWHTYESKTLAITKVTNQSRGNKRKSEYQHEWRDAEFHLFAYKQKPNINVRSFIQDHTQYQNDWFAGNMKKLRKLAFKEGYWRYPHFSYGCAFMVGVIRPRNYTDEHLFSWCSGDDDLGNEFEFPSDRLEDVKSFIKENCHHESFSFLLSEFVLENKFQFI